MSNCSDKDPDTKGGNGQAEDTGYNIIDAVGLEDIGIPVAW